MVYIKLRFFPMVSEHLDMVIFRKPFHITNNINMKTASFSLQYYQEKSSFGAAGNSVQQQSSMAGIPVGRRGKEEIMRVGVSLSTS